LISNERISIVPIKPFPNILPRSFLLLYAPFKLLFQIIQLLWVLLVLISPPDIILVQNPPSIPVLAVLFIAKLILRTLRRKKTDIIIDWHNFGYTILQLSFSPNHPIVVIAKYYEKLFGRISTTNLCVTFAMKEFLEKEWNIKATVLYDKPPDCFKETNSEEAHELMLLLEKENKELKFFYANSESKNIPKGLFLEESSLIYSKCKDEKGEIQYIKKENAPVILVSSTSWTPDEDFSVLLNAMIHCEKLIKESDNPEKFPEILLFITGKGPLKEYYENLIAKQNFEKTRIVTVWLSAENYPKLLGMSDLGISLHTSSSGLDLPMKVVDMFGCKLPVCAIGFPW